MELKPKIRNGFSHRNGFQQLNTTIQINDLDERTRTKLINFFILLYEKYSSFRSFIEYIYTDIFIMTLDQIPTTGYKGKYQTIRISIEIVSNLRNWSIDEIFTFFEGIGNFLPRYFNYTNYFKELNQIFEEECVGYRFVDSKITTITSEQEIKEIETAINSQYEACNNSIKKAVKLLYDRDHPDFSNSIKESISAIEAMCNIIAKEKKPLGQTLDILIKKGAKIHPVFITVFDKLYGYTSDQSGIRHNYGIDENTTFEEAKFMLITCSAFINYLTSLYEKYV